MSDLKIPQFVVFFIEKMIDLSYDIKFKEKCIELKTLK
jgi:hypothetical protein